jgi:hypothetical protein
MGSDEIERMSKAKESNTPFYAAKKQRKNEQLSFPALPFLALFER